MVLSKGYFHKSEQPVRQNERPCLSEAVPVSPRHCENDPAISYTVCTPGGQIRVRNEYCLPASRTSVAGLRDNLAMRMQSSLEARGPGGTVSWVTVSDQDSHAGRSCVCWGVGSRHWKCILGSSSPQLRLQLSEGAQCVRSCRLESFLNLLCWKSSHNILVPMLASLPMVDGSCGRSN